MPKKRPTCWCALTYAASIRTASLVCILYFELLSEQRINPRPQLKVIRSTLSTATVDGDNGLGFVVGPQANRIAMELAAKSGTGWVSVCNTNHFGTAGYYVLKALEHDLIGWAMTNSTKPSAPLNAKAESAGVVMYTIAFSRGTGVESGWPWINVR